MDEQDIQKNQKHFSEKNFWKKVKNISIKSGSSIIYVVLLMYYTMNKPEVPLSIKATIAGALGYFILPFDLIPDVAAGVGYADDLTVLTAALFQVVMYIDEDIKQQAKDKLNVLFGDDIDTTEVDEKLSNSNKSVE
ncbi:YkvA family protein [Alkalibacillus sp. S2W]|uniref:YkvA family protein n=1 Tax=Alkalibacillus sp. S2W TaxID=3386553 RepID=UPI00398C8FFB